MRYKWGHSSFIPLGSSAARTDSGFGAVLPEEKIAYADTGHAYYGRFEIDEVEFKVRHLIEGLLFAFETGTTYVRTVHLEDDVLTLKTVDFLKASDGETFNQWTWTRM